MWRALQAHRDGTPVWTGEPTHRGRSIEEIVGLTWQPNRMQAFGSAAAMVGYGELHTITACSPT
ncbi:MAG: hypothetical protein H7Z75_19110 [Ferruginibacter sp.]|nr:hypothetical protein [Cytophagales bacterium]